MIVEKYRQLIKQYKSLRITNYLPLFLLLCFSGNPIITAMSYSKNLLVIYSFAFIFYIFSFVNYNYLKIKIQQILLVILFIVFLTLYQKFLIGFVSYPGVFALILKILLGLFTLIFYRVKRIGFMDSYIKVMAFLTIISLPFFVLNQFGNWGIQLDNEFLKSFFFHTTFPVEIYSDSFLIRNPGMFWEPGAFAGYLLLALLFIVLKNRSITIGRYKKEVLWIIIGITTSQSTTGYFLLGIVILLFIWNRYRWSRIIVVPATVLLVFWGYNSISFLGDKVEDQYSGAVTMGENDVSNTRFGSLNMDMQYIMSQPFTGNGLDVSTRYRFHPWVKEDIGNGNGMSNFIACWGIPFFLFWFYCAYRFAYLFTRKKSVAFFFMVMMVLVLQGEQFLNYPMFLIFFSIPTFYNNFSFKKNHYGLRRARRN
jgi:hypothetical protein